MGENNGKGNIKVALAQVLAAHDSNLPGIPVEAEPLNALMSSIAGASQGTIAAIPLTATKAEPLKWTQSVSVQHAQASTAQYDRTNRVSTRGFARWSYSALSKTLKGDHDNKDGGNDIVGATDESNDIPLLPPLVSDINIELDIAKDTMPLYDIAGSSTFGNTVHEIFDSINPASAQLSEDVYDEVEYRFVNTHSPEQRAKITEGIIASIHAPLGGPFVGNTLHTLGTTHRLSELEFNFHLPHSDTGAFPLSEIGALMLRHGNLDPHLTAYAQDIADNPSTTTVAGYMTGSIDAVFRMNSETSKPVYVVADYKTNRLYDPANAEQNPLTAYHPDNLVASMVKDGFILQALVYSVALHRYLQWRQPGYDPNIHLGGVAYLYVRGMTGHSTDEPAARPYGVYHWRPATELVLALDALFAGKGN
jgi:exodeoxyribonuclease V beta subunit